MSFLFRSCLQGLCAVLTAATLAAGAVETPHGLGNPAGAPATSGPGTSGPGTSALAPAEVHTGHATLRLHSERSVVAPGDHFHLLLSLASIPHWHTYWKNPGDTGLPTRVTWTLPEGVQAGPIEWPLPSRLATPPLMSFGFEGSAGLLIPITLDAHVQGIVPLRARVRWLVCAEQCIPESAEVALSLPVGAGAQPGADTPLVAAALAALPGPATGWSVQARSDGRNLQLVGRLPEGQQAPGRLWLYPDRKGLIAPAAAQAYHRDGRRFTLTVPLAAAGPGGSAVDGAAATAAPAESGASRVATAAAPVADAAAISDALTAGRLEGLLASDADGSRAHGWLLDADLQAAPGPLAVPADNGDTVAMATGVPAADRGTWATLAAALGLAFVGGLLLNLMPCVLPVLSIKVFALLGDAAAPRGHLIRQGLMFLAGVLVSFWVLAGLLLSLKSAGAAVGWGFQLQSAPFVVGLACLFTLLGLNFAGLFEVGTGLQARVGTFEQQLGRRGAGDLASFSAGVLTTLVATPCTAPFLGAGIGFTLNRSGLEALLVFTAMGLGVGLPVTLLAIFPGWLRHVPRPGAWMETLKQLFAFPMFATVAWLGWVLGHQRGVDSLAGLLFGLVLLGLSGWLWGRAQRSALRAPRGLAGRIDSVLALCALCTGVWVALPGPAPASAAGSSDPAAASAAGVPAGASVAATPLDWQPYSAARLAALRAAGRPVFVDFTAAWCISCQVNKRTSLAADRVVSRMHALGVATLEADWTNADPEITAALAGLQRNAVPVYAVYPKGGGEPRLLPEVLTPALVVEAVERAAGS